MDRLARLPLQEFLNELASSAPTPGGGAAAALGGALAAGLGQMVCKLSAGKSAAPETCDKVKHFRARFERADALLRRLIDEDAEAYGQLNAAFKISRDDSTRGKRIARASALAASVPLETALICRRIELDLRELSPIANPNLSADLRSAQAFAIAGRSAAVANVRANLLLLTPPDRARIDAELARLEDAR